MHQPKMPRKRELPIGLPIEVPDPPCALAMMPTDTPPVVAVLSLEGIPIPAGHSPAWFHTRVLPIWSRIPPPVKSFSPNKAWSVDCSGAFGHADRINVVGESEEVLSWQHEPFHFTQRVVHCQTFASLVLRHLPTDTMLIFPRIRCRMCIDGPDEGNQPLNLWDFQQLYQHRTSQHVIVSTNSVN